eukprot:1976783-Pyramimonas_sp.AAC.1
MCAVGMRVNANKTKIMLCFRYRGPVAFGQRSLGAPAPTPTSPKWNVTLEIASASKASGVHSMGSGGIDSEISN